MRDLRPGLRSRRRSLSKTFGGTIPHVMFKWLKGMVAPTLLLWLFAIAFGVASSLAPGGQMPVRANLASRVAFPIIISFWVVVDARKRRKQLCYDFDSFVFFASPIIVPVYLFQTRGVRAFLTLLCFAAIWLIGMLPVFVVSFIREFAP